LTASILKVIWNNLKSKYNSHEERLRDWPDDTSATCRFISCKVLNPTLSARDESNQSIFLIGLRPFSSFMKKALFLFSIKVKNFK
jgi:hypothetical protein